MLSHPVFACALLIATTAAAAPPLAPLQSAPLTAPYQPRSGLTLVEGGQVKAVLLVPGAPEFAAAAEAAAGRLETVLGTKLTRLPEADYRPDGRTVIALGNCFTGPLVRRLYANHLVCSDGSVPGSGYELRTIPAALDLGDVLFLGGSTPAGVQLAAAALAKRLQPGPTVRLAYLVDCSGAFPRPAPPGEAQLIAQVESLQKLFASFTSNKISSAIGQLEAAARGFYLTGDEAFGRLYGQLLQVTVDFYRTSKSEPPTFVLPALISSLDQVEESAGMTPEQRLLGAEWLRLIVEDTMKYWEMSRPRRLYAEGRRSVAWNHETHPCLSVAQAAQYLRHRYQVPACDYWEGVCENLFAGQVDIDQPLEDSANYQWLVHQHLAQYVLVTGRLDRFLTGEGFRRHLECAIASHDSLGDEATHGDAWQTFGSIAGMTFTLGTVCFNDPRCGYLLDLVGRPQAGALWRYAGAGPGQVPEDQVGLKTFTVDPVRSEALGIEGIPPGKVLDKVVIRSGWRPGDEYLMLDGLNVGNHKHVDANAIIRYRANRRLWLVDMDYIRSAPWHHNSLAVTRDGLAPDQRPAGHDGAQVIAAQPFAAELLGSVAAEGLALTRSLLKDYAGLDWTRNVFWAAGRGFIVVDDLVARQPGDYLTRCLWRTLGEVRARGNTLEVTQQGEHYAGNRFLRVLDDQGRQVVELIHPEAAITFARELAAGTYGLSIIAKGPNGGADSLWVRLDEEAPVDYHLPQNDYGDSSGAPLGAAPGRPLLIKAAGRHQLTVTLRESPGARLDCLVLTAPDGTRTRLPAADLVADQIQRVDDPEQAFVISNGDGSQLKLAEQFDYGHGGPQGYYAGYRYAGPMTKVLSQVKHQRLSVGQRLQYVNLFGVRAAAARPPAGLRPVAAQAWVAGDQQPLLVALGPLSLPRLQIEAQASLLTDTGLVAHAARKVTLGTASWSAATPTDLKLRFSGKGPGLGGLAPAAVAALLRALPARALPPTVAAEAPVAPAGRELLRQPAPLTALATAEGLIVAGDADGGVVAAAADGPARWRYAAGSKVRTLAPVRQPGGTCWAVGTGGGDVVLLGPDGAVRWQYRCEPYHGRPGAVATIFGADLDGDGGQEVIAGSENHHYHALSSEGKLLWRTETVHASTVGSAADLNADGRDEIFAGTEYYWPRLLDPQGKMVGSYSAGPVTSAVAAADVDGDGKGEAFFGMEDCFVHATRLGAGWLWEANVGGTPRRIVPLGPGAPAALAVATDMNSVVFLDGAGKRLGYVPLPDRARDLVVVGGGMLLAGCGDGGLYRVAPDGAARAVAVAPGAISRLVAVSDQTVAAACGTAVVVVTVR